MEQLLLLMDTTEHQSKIGQCLQMPQWVQKNPRPQGGGATTTKVQTEFVATDKTHLHLIHLTLQNRLGYIEQILINIICSKTQLQVSI